MEYLVKIKDYLLSNKKLVVAFVLGFVLGHASMQNYLLSLLP